MTLNSLGAKCSPSLILNQFSPGYETLHACGTAKDFSKNTKILIKTRGFLDDFTIFQDGIFMNKSNSPHIITQVCNNCAYWKDVIGKVNKFFLNLLNSNTTNIAKEIFIIPTKDIQKK